MRSEQPVTEYENEPIPGLPELPPEGERILWQGAPDWRALARRGFHTRGVAIYFALLVVWRVAASPSPEPGLFGALASAGPLVGLGLLALGILTLLAWLNARATVYTITSRRVVVRFGVAVPLAVNFPFAAIRSIELKVHGDGTGDIPLAVEGAQQLGYLMLWPHARPWAFGANAEPMLRAVPDARAVGERLSGAIRATNRRSPARLRPEPADAPARPVAAVS